MTLQTLEMAATINVAMKFGVIIDLPQISGKIIPVLN
jgi:hypothetical protein